MLAAWGSSNWFCLNRMPHLGNCPWCNTRLLQKVRRCLVKYEVLGCSDLKVVPSIPDLAKRLDHPR